MLKQLVVAFGAVLLLGASNAQTGAPLSAASSFSATPLNCAYCSAEFVGVVGPFNGQYEGQWEVTYDGSCGEGDGDGCSQCDGGIGCNSYTAYNYYLEGWDGCPSCGDQEPSENGEKLSDILRAASVAADRSDVRELKRLLTLKGTPLTINRERHALQATGCNNAIVIHVVLNREVEYALSVGAPAAR